MPVCFFFLFLHVCACACVHVQGLDLTKANYTLRVAVDQSQAENIVVKKDVERIEQIKAIKRAWEAAEPGRAAKVTEWLPVSGR